MLRLLDSVIVFVTLLCTHPYPTGKRAPDPVQPPGAPQSPAAAPEVPAVACALSRGGCHPMLTGDEVLMAPSVRTKL